MNWPDSRLFTFPSDAPCVVLDHPDLLAEIIGILAWDPLSTSHCGVDGLPGQRVPAQTEVPNHLGPRARSVSRPAPLSNPAMLPDILASLRALVPHMFAGGLHRTLATSVPPAGTAPLRIQPRMTTLRRSPRTRSETGQLRRNPLPAGLPWAQSTGTSHPARVVASVAPDAKKIAHREGVRGKSARPGHAP